MNEAIVVGIFHTQGDLDHAIIDCLHVVQRNIETKIQIYSLNVFVHISVVSLLLETKFVNFLALSVLESIGCFDTFEQVQRKPFLNCRRK